MKIEKFKQFKKNINESSEVNGNNNSAMQHNYYIFFDMEREIESFENYLYDLNLVEDQIDDEYIDIDTLKRNIEELSILKESILSLTDELKDKIRDGIYITEQYNQDHDDQDYDEQDHDEQDHYDQRQKVNNHIIEL